MQMRLDDLKIRARFVNPWVTNNDKIGKWSTKKLVEIDEQVSFVEHMDEDDSSAVISINKFNVDPDEVDEFLKAFAATD